MKQMARMVAREAEMGAVRRILHMPPHMQPPPLKTGGRMTRRAEKEKAPTPSSGGEQQAHQLREKGEGKGERKEKKKTKKQWQRPPREKREIEEKRERGSGCH